MAQIGPKERALRELGAAKHAAAAAPRKPAAKPPAQPKENPMFTTDNNGTSTPAPERRRGSPKKTPKKKTVKKAVKKLAKKAKRVAKKKKPAEPVRAAQDLRAGSKVAMIAAMLQAPGGCTVKEVLAATGWPSVSMPQQAKAAGLELRKESTSEGNRYYGSPPAG
jgi:hypothetical protein